MTIREDVDGGVCLEDLEAKLLAHADRPLKIGSFSAASNVTGIVSDTYGIASSCTVTVRSPSGTSRPRDPTSRSR